MKRRQQMDNLIKEDKLIEIKNLKKYFPVKSGFKSTNVKAVDDVSLYIRQGETLGLVGESGCGKTSLGRTILRLHEPTEGQILFHGEDITKANMHSLRRKMQIIFQDPYASLDPRMTVGDIIAEPLDIHKMYKSKAERQEKIYSLLKTVGLNREHANRFPNEFSCGQIKRIGIARALAVEPEFIVCDEPVSALDVSIQAQIVNMLEDLQQEKKLTYLFIAHDLSIVKHISNRIGVMYLGHLVELTTSKELYSNPLHPYTRTLLSAIPIADPKTSREKERIVLKGDIPSPINPPSGCPFRTRCPYATDICAKERPELKDYNDGHLAACHNIKNIQDKKER
jgi:oligopeptide transport system ATP-binding protein